MSQSRTESKAPNLSTLCNLVKENNHAAIKNLIDAAKAARDWRWKYSDGDHVECAVRDAILLGQIETVKLFLEAGVSGDTYAYTKGHSGCLSKLISFAAESGNLDMVKLLVENDAQIKPRDSYYNTGDDSAITTAVKQGHIEIAKYLLEQGATANGVIHYGMRRLTFLGEAALQGNSQMMELLLQHGAKVEIAIPLAEEKFNEEIRYYPSKKVELKATYHKLLKTLMYYATGADFSKEQYSNWSYRDFGGLTFLKEMDVDGFNFLGVSVAGKPVTKDMLLAKKVMNADKVILTMSDLKQTEKKYSDIVEKQLNRIVQKQGQLTASNGIVNLIPLWRAAEVGDEKAVITRLKAGIDPNEKNDDKEVPIVIAAQNGHLDIVKILLNHPKLNITSLVSAIKAAQNAGHQDIADFLASKQDINQKDENGNTRLHHAVYGGNVDEVKKLIKNGADVNMEGTKGYPLYIAANQSYDSRYFGEASAAHIEIIKILLEAKADPNSSSYRNQVALDAAASCGSLDAMKLLLPLTKKTVKTDKIGLDHVEITYPWYLDMMFDSYRSKDWLEILKLLKSEGADFNLKDPRCSRTLLQRVLRDFPSFTDISSDMRGIAFSIRGCENRVPADSLQKTQDYLIDQSVKSFLKHITLLDYILENGGSPNVKDEDGNTPLHEFMKHVDLRHVADGYQEVIDRCLKKEFKIDTQNKYGRTLLHIAASQGDLTAVKYLLSRGANVNVLDEDGRSPLFLAAAGNPETTKCLIAAGATIHIKDKEGLTPEQYSEKACQSDVKRYMFNSVQAKDDFMKPYRQAQTVIWTAASQNLTTQQNGLFSGTQNATTPDVVMTNEPRVR